MKQLSDDDVVKNLKKLGESMQPSQKQKDKLYDGIFLSNNRREKFRINTWMPTIVSLVLLLSVVSGVYVIISNNHLLGMGSPMKDVTASWNGVVLYQESTNDLTNYILSFEEDSLIIKDEIIGGMNVELSEAEIYKKAEEFQAEKEKLTLQAGEYSDYRIIKNKESYDITVLGEEGFTYTLEKIAPRKFIGEDGIGYKTSSYTVY